MRPIRDNSFTYYHLKHTSKIDSTRFAKRLGEYLQYHDMQNVMYLFRLVLYSIQTQYASVMARLHFRAMGRKYLKKV